MSQFHFWLLACDPVPYSAVVYCTPPESEVRRIIGAKPPRTETVRALAKRTRALGTWSHTMLAMLWWWCGLWRFGDEGGGWMRWGGYLTVIHTGGTSRRTRVLCLQGATYTGVHSTRTRTHTHSHTRTRAHTHTHTHAHTHTHRGVYSTHMHISWPRFPTGFERECVWERRAVHLVF
jgi:hypothetical protein